MSLTEALRAGAPEVFGRLYDEHAGRLYAYCRTMVGDEASDAVRDAFISAARHPGTVRDDEALPVWLYALARTECVRRGALLRNAPAGPADEPIPRALARLRPEHREVLALSATLETGDVARVIGLAPDTAELLTRMARRRLEQAAVSVLGSPAARDDEMLTALGRGSLHKLVARGPEPPPRLRERVLAACAAAERAVDGALLFGQDGMPIPLDGLFGPANEITRPLRKTGAGDLASLPHGGNGVAVAPPKEDGVLVARSRRKKKEPFLTRRRGGLVEMLGLAACVAVAASVFALWPKPHDGDTSTMDGTSLLLHRGSPANRSVRSPAGASSQLSTTSGAGASPVRPAKRSTAPKRAATTAPAHSATPPTTAGTSSAHPTPQPSIPPTTPPRPTPSTPLPGIPPLSKSPSPIFGTR
ncbi:MAG: polymerase, sigma-24 subunit, subfamily [Actinoallomurus sp.]|nr:polymerase, sigma-24 subunit, subfamily [Actinoallomurus sp.]